MRPPGEVAFEIVVMTGIALAGFWVLDRIQLIPELRLMQDGPIVLTFALVVMLMYPGCLWVLQRGQQWAQKSK